MRTHLLRLQVIVGEAEAGGDVIRNVTEVVGVVDLVPGFLHSTAVFLGRAAGTRITAEEEGLDGSLEFVDFGLRGKVLRIVRDQFRAEAMVGQLLDSVRILHGSLADFNSLSDLQHSGRLGIHSTDFDLASFAGIRGLGAGLEHSYGPKDLVYSFCVCHNLTIPFTNMRIRGLGLDKGAWFDFLIRVRILNKTLFHKSFQQNRPTGCRDEEEVVNLRRDKNRMS
jgi:hypothetical protein